MQTAKDLTSSAASGIESRNASQTRTTPPGRMVCSTKEERKSEIGRLVNRVFTRMEAIFPRTWRMSFTTDEMLSLAKRELALSMAKWSSLPTLERLDMAIERIKNDGGNWPPSIAEMCLRLKPSYEDFGLPSADQAFKEASQYALRSGHVWSHDAIREALVKVGSWDLGHASSESQIYRLRKLFFAEYEAVCNRILAGESIGDDIALIESDEFRSAYDLAVRAADEKRDREMREFWAARGEEPPKDSKETMQRLRSILDEPKERAQ